MEVLDKDGKLASAYSAYTMPVFRSPIANNSWLPQTSPAYNAIASGSPTWYNVNFAVVNNTMVTLDITNHNSTDNPAYYGDTATVKLAGKGAEISPLSNYIQWTDTDGNKVGDPVPVTLVSDGAKANLTISTDGNSVTINGTTYDLKNQIKTGDVFTATLYEGNDTNPVAKDSFVVKARDKDLYEPAYAKTTVSAGDKATVTPTFTDENGSAVTMPEGTIFSVDPTSPSAEAGWATINSATGEITYQPGTEQSGDYYVPVTVTYPDGTSEVVNAQVVVSNQAKEYTATGGDLTKPYGEATTSDDVISKVSTDYPTSGAQPTITVDDPSSLPDGTKPGSYEIPVTVTYPDGTTDTTSVKVTVLDQIIDQTKNPDAPTPEGYVRVTFQAGDHGSFADGSSYIFDVKKGTAFSELTLPTVTPANGYIQKSGTDAWSPVLPTTVDVAGTYIAQYEEQTQPTDADKYAPAGQDITTEQGTEPSAADGISNKGDLPDGTTYTWKDTPDVSTPGTKPATVVVTYPDGSKDEVPVNVTVTPTTPAATDADKYTAKGGELTKPYGEATTSDDVISKVTTDYPTSGAQPTITVDDPSSLPDGTKPGSYEIPVTVTYPDGSKDETSVTVNVLDKIIDQTKNPDAPTPEGYVRVTFQAGDHGSFADGSSYIFDVKKGTAFSELTLPTVIPASGYIQKSGTDAWSPALPTTVDEAGTYTAQYEEQTQPTDADKYTPTGQDITTEQGTEPNAADGISNKGDLPDGTTYTWKDTPDVSTPGTKPATVVVTYPDGSKDEVPVNVTVTPTTPAATDADKYTPAGQDITTEQGTEPSAADGISNKGDLPDGTTYTWKDTPDVSTPGTKPATVVVTYPDGSKDEVPVNVIVKEPTKTPTDADKNTPEPQPIDTPQGTVPDPSDGIKNKDDLPGDTKYTWEDPDKVAQDVKTPGTYDETVIVTYPDGSQDKLIVQVTVTEPAKSDNQENDGANNSNVPTVNNSVKAENNVISMTKNTQKANTLPQTGNTNNSAAVTGLGLASFLAMLGLGYLKKHN